METTADGPKLRNISIFNNDIHEGPDIIKIEEEKEEKISFAQDPEDLEGQENAHQFEMQPLEFEDAQK